MLIEKYSMATARTEASEATVVAIAKRRARNRVSQKSFRERQTIYVKQLERQLAEASCDEGARLRDSQRECQTLREALLAARKRIRGLTTALSGVTDDIGRALDLHDETSSQEDCLEGRPTNEASIETPVHETAAPQVPWAATEIATPESQCHCIERQHLPVAPPTALTVPSTCAEDLVQDTTTQNDVQHSTSFDCTYDSPASAAIQLQRRLIGEPNNYLAPGSRNIQPVLASMDASWYLQNNELQTMLPSISHSYSNLAFTEASQASDISGITLPPGNPTFPSTFSAHLAVCEFFIKQNKIYKRRYQPDSNDALPKLVSNMVNMFINVAWPEMRVWWAYMQSSAAVEKIMRWRLDPSPESYEALTECHRPTATQLTVIHPAIIDWVFFPSVRDRMIELYSDSWILDQLVCELLTAYVVEADLSKLLSDMSETMPGVPRRGYFRIWDLVQVISREDPDHIAPTDKGHDMVWQGTTFGIPHSPFELEEEDTESEWIPIPLGEVFHSRSAAMKLFKLLRMDDRRSVKLDPHFASKHPELCDDPRIFAQGVDCTLKTNVVPVLLPEPLTRATIMNYKLMLWKTVT